MARHGALIHQSSFQLDRARLATSNYRVDFPSVQFLRVPHGLRLPSSARTSIRARLRGQTCCILGVTNCDRPNLPEVCRRAGELYRGKSKTVSALTQLHRSAFTMTPFGRPATSCAPY